MTSTGWETLCSLPELLEKNRDSDFLLADELAAVLCFFYSKILWALISCIIIKILSWAGSFSGVLGNFPNNFSWVPWAKCCQTLLSDTLGAPASAETFYFEAKWITSCIVWAPVREIRETPSPFRHKMTKDLKVRGWAHTHLKCSGLWFLIYPAQRKPRTKLSVLVACRRAWVQHQHSKIKRGS